MNRPIAFLPLLAIGLAISPVVHAASTASALALPNHTIAFLVLTVIATIYFGHVRFDRFSVSHGPEILTTIGIFGCFFGVSAGLLAFDTADLTKSVPSMLEGIKTAFWASLAGIGGALYIKGRHTFRREPIPQAVGTTGGSTTDDVVVALNNLQRSISNETDSSLVGQLKLMRQDQTDGFRRMQESFQEFAKTMAEQNSKALIEALNEVIRDFNRNLTEQFGENFKQLNIAVEKLVLWQQQYKEELDLLKLAQQQAADDMRSATDSFTRIVSQSEHFGVTAEKLSSLIKVLQAELDRTLEIERALHKALGEMSQVAPVFAQRSGELLVDLKAGLASVVGEIEQLTKGVATATQQNNAEMRRAITESLTEAARQFNQHVQQISKDTADRVTKLDEALGKELSKALETMGQQLTALSRKFVEDYTPLTARLREVVQMTKQV